MLSEARIQANRQNAKKSTGPRTPAGKAASSRNRTTHGLCAGNYLLPGEDPAAFEALVNDLRTRFRPVGAAEDKIVMRIASAQYRLDRVAAIEIQIFESHIAQMSSFPEEVPYTERLGKVFMKDASGSAQTLQRLSRYETTLQRSITTSLKQLEAFQQARAAAEQAEQPEQPDQAGQALAPAAPPPAASRTLRNEPKPAPGLDPAARVPHPPSAPNGPGSGVRTGS
ncbi:MAG TPA: hypothetical protein VMI94_10075 [Bryobacteraceae bacterium]|nr:hypothetical protein [Bryobacteraceae bacterium]